MRGGVRNSEAEKDLAGRPGRRKALGVIPDLHQPLGGPPDFLLPLARQEWDHVMQQLGATGLLQEVDRAALAAHCMSYARWQEAEAILARDGVIIEEPVMNSRGELKGHRMVKHPAVGIAKDALTSMRSFAGLFGLDPTNRARMVIPRAPEKPLLDRILDGDDEEPN